MKYKILNKNKIVDRHEIAHLLFQKTIEYLVNFEEDYFRDEWGNDCDFPTYLDYITMAKYGETNDIIKILYEQWNIQIEKI